LKTDRLLAITLHLINHKRATARELAHRFEVSQRTIQRDIDSLACAGIPIYSDRGRGGGYRILENYSVDRQFFTTKELGALTSIVGRLNNLLGQSGLRATEEKLRHLADSQESDRVHEPLIMDFTPWGLDRRTKELFRTVYQAVETSQVLQIRYASPRGERTNRQIEPLSVIIKGAAWYVYAYCRLRQAPRLFKLTRIIEAVTTTLYFVSEDHPPYRDEDRDLRDARPTTLFVLRFSPSARGRVTDFVSSENVHDMPDGTIMGFFPMPEDEWVYSWILSFGPLVEVLEPPHARERIVELARTLSESYSTGQSTLPTTSS